MSAKVLMYATGVCPYCIRAEQLLHRKGITEIEKIRVDLDKPDWDMNVAYKYNAQTTTSDMYSAATGALILTPASISANVLPQVLAIEEEPLLSITSDVNSSV